MEEKATVSKCKKCGEEPIFRRNSSGLLVQVKCPCKESSFECTYKDAISSWEKINR